MWAFSFLQRTYNLNEKETKKVSLYLDDNLRPQVKIEAPSGRVLLNDIQWFILVKFKDNILKGDRLCGLVVRVSGYRYRGLGFDSRRY